MGKTIYFHAWICNLCNLARAGVVAQEQTCEKILPCVSDHAGPQASAPEGECAEERSEDSNHKHALHALVAVGGAEQKSLRNNSHQRVAAGGMELLLQVSAKDQFFTEPRGNGDRSKEDELPQSVWCKEVKRADHFLCLLHVLGVVETELSERESHPGKNTEGNDPEPGGDADVKQDVFGGLPLSSYKITQTKAAPVNAQPDNEDHGPLNNHGGDVEGKPPAVLHRSAQPVCLA